MPSPTPGDDHLEIRDLRVVGVHGALFEEKKRAQPFSLDLDVWFDTARPAETDTLGDTADYAAMLDVAAAVVAERTFSLLEALAATVADAVLEVDARVEAVRVTVRKVRPPVPHDVGSIGVTVARRRGGGG